MRFLIPMLLAATALAEPVKVDPARWAQHTAALTTLQLTADNAMLKAQVATMQLRAEYKMEPGDAFGPDGTIVKPAKPIPKAMAPKASEAKAVKPAAPSPPPVPPAKKLPRMPEPVKK